MELPEEARATLLVLIETKVRLHDQIAKLNAEISRRAKENEVARRLMTILGIGPLIATAHRLPNRDLQAQRRRSACLSGRHAHSYCERAQTI